MENIEENYSEGGSFETTIGNTQYEVVINFKQEGLSLQEKAIRAVKESIHGDSEEEYFSQGGDCRIQSFNGESRAD